MFLPCCGEDRARSADGGRQAGSASAAGRRFQRAEVGSYLLHLVVAETPFRNGRHFPAALTHFGEKLLIVQFEGHQCGPGIPLALGTMTYLADLFVRRLAGMRVLGRAGKCRDQGEYGNDTKTCCRRQDGRGSELGQSGAMLATPAEGCQ